MKCLNCGFEVDPNTGICSYCNKKYEANDNSNQNNANDQQQNSYQNPARPNMYSNYYAMNRPANNQEVSVGRWIGRMLISWIPFVGPLVNFIMLIVWACSDRFERTSNNWAIASIIVSLVGLLFAIIFLIIYGSIIYQIMNSYF